MDETQTKPTKLSFCVEVLLNTLYLLILQRCLAQYRHRALRVNGLSQPNAKKTLHVLPVGAYCFPPAGRRTGAGKKNAHLHVRKRRRTHGSLARGSLFH